ncbi:MAG: Rrf2 family transcriptional regulator [Acutalibacteraceae bacterium]|nr:Rrf2 family transcriptional regulator [Clostridia bacterium]MEE1144834.1 Rrf2 family transcriptional regulator [Acutalibacteraceae bacterium]
MKINLETDYAVRIVQSLANSGERMDANTLSERTGVTPRFALKILRKLVSAGLVNSYKGVGGGYELKSPPEEITLLQVIETIEGPIVISRCQQSGYQCDHPDDCSCYFHHLYNEVASDIAKKFGAVTFAPKKVGPNK